MQFDKKFFKSFLHFYAYCREEIERELVEKLAANKKGFHRILYGKVVRVSLPVIMGYIMLFLAQFNYHRLFIF